MKISVIGGGYVGLVSAVCFAQLGHTVGLIEIDIDRASSISRGSPQIYEKGLEALLSKHLEKSLHVSTAYDAIPDTEIFFICVGTPEGDNGHPDLSMIQSACQSLGRSLIDMDSYHVVVVKSTVPPGTTEGLVVPTVLEHSQRAGDEIGFCMNPEFLREGRAVEDFMHPDRIVIGSNDSRAGDWAESAYRGIEAPIVRTGIKSAEMIKYASNAFLATKISFANEIGNLCKRLGIDVYEVMEGVGMDHRISPHFLDAGAGFGGSCFPKDLSALIHLAEGMNEEPLILRSVQNVNERQPARMLELLQKKIGSLEGKRIAVLGLAFKNDTDDVRQSRSIPVILELEEMGARIAAYDPQANDNMKKLIPDIEYCSRVTDALEDADACIVMTEWPEFRLLDEEFDLMKNRVIIEGRRILSCQDKEGICW
ncbi:UDP-glucose dehydrogenase family protein [Methanothrix soehngenii]|jgi:UDPglucose 6-dehydrogenase|uniref:UDP-glucose dehydrogenase family protein n=1 Tax=Methanothrix soehngenii TaxID=2223 RepID=UPI002B81A2C7|nr:UDP-glucose/GDP-mannose dehydrogenase family protein [Methanothrix soehngenii]HOS21816.1 UDP-glucose/GDP-mannose dehydrogenase family protein [Methanothrix soehngenii]HPL20229.1 UDP-glucose/GDP-mannose dehydrogenase family protein [Methanothrix soehngenii]